MEKALFDQLLLNYTALDSSEAIQVIELSREYPYSQVLHLMAARGAQDNSFNNKEDLLHTSAIYSTDRAVLKEIMLSPKLGRAHAFVESAPTVVTLEKEKSPQTLPETHLSDSFYQQVLDDIAKMHESKRLYELTIEKMESHEAVPLAEVEEEKYASNSDGLIEEIKSTKKKMKPEGEKQKEQIEIIDQFIKTKPSVPRATKPATNGEDLSETSSNLNENIVSETLVEILLKQGKKEKAIEVLKKLIWKFPQKKAYFAARIEDLKK